MKFKIYLTNGVMVDVSANDWFIHEGKLFFWRNNDDGTEPSMKEITNDPVAVFFEQDVAGVVKK
jgi:hypothetical protein